MKLFLATASARTTESPEKMKKEKIIAEAANLVQHWNGQQEVGTNWGLLLGFCTTVTIKGLLQVPLSTLLNGCISGALCGLGGTIVQETLPKDLRFLIPVSCIGCIVYTQIKSLVSNKDPTQGFIVNMQ